MRRLQLKQKEEKEEEVSRFIMQYYRKNKDIVNTTISLLCYRESYWRCQLFKVLSEIVTSQPLADQYRHYAIYYHQSYSTLLLSLPLS
jgi:hypothetical protein